MTKADGYRKRATAIGKSLKGRTKKAQGPLVRKQKALSDMAANEDWLDGKSGSGLKPEKT